MSYKKILFSLCVGAAAMTACTDTWDEHYNSNGDGDAAGTQTLWEMVKSDPELSNFARVMEATHFDRNLSSGQMLTLWAVPISAEEANTWIAAYQADSLAGIKEEDNAAIVRFVQNHVCMYNRTVSTLTVSDTVQMLNGKYKYLSYETLDDAEMTVKNRLATNGVFFKINKTLPFFNNIYEELMSNPKVSLFAEMLKGYNVYELDESSSVPGEIIDGQIHYLDSVTYMSNKLMTMYGARITREDSTYLLFVPDNDVYEAQYNRYSKYFVYPPLTVDRDSLQDVRAKQAIFCSRVFNINPEVNPEMAKEEPALRDSLMCTEYSQFDWENYVYYKPFAAGGIFDGKESVACSNGYLYIDNEDKTIDPRRTFMADTDFPATSRWIYGADDEPLDSRDDREKQKQYAASVVSVKMTDSLEVDGEMKRLNIYNDRYIIFEGSANNSTTTQFSYSLPNLMSNLYYNVYFVFVPPVAENDPNLNDDEGLAVKFRAYLHEMNEAGKLTTGTGAANRILDLETGARDMETKAGIVDTLCLLKAHQFNYTTFGGDNVAYIYFTSNVSNNENQRTYTRRIRMNSVILRAFETEEQAKEDYETYLKARNQK